MRAMILAAGLGTRLQPLTFVRPKVLVPVMGTTVLEFWIWQFHAAGFEAVAINAFHLHEDLVSSIRGRKWPIPVETFVEPLLLDTGGGIRNALGFFEGEPFVVVNGDSICRLPLEDSLRRHMASGSSSSLVIHDHPMFNNVAVDEIGFVLGFGREAKSLAAQRSDVRLLAFTGVHFINPNIIESLAPRTPSNILDTYRRCIESGDPPRALLPTDLSWREMGTLNAYRSLNDEISRLRPGALPPFPTGNSVWIHPKAQVASDIITIGYIAIGEGSWIGEKVTMENTILWDRVVVEDGSELHDCIVTDDVTVRGRHQGEVLYGEGGCAG